MATSKARKRLGSEMTVQQRRRMMKHDKEESLRRRAEMRKALVAAINMPPSTSQLKLPKACQGPVARKALLIFGDDLLSILSLRQLPMHAKVTPKVIQIFGEPELLPPKARSLMVGDVLPDHAQSAAAAAFAGQKRQRRGSFEALSFYFTSALSAFDKSS